MRALRHTAAQNPYPEFRGCGSGSTGLAGGVWPASGSQGPGGLWCAWELCGMVELGLAILFLGVLLVAERKRREQFTDVLRRFIDWMEQSS